MLGEAEALVDGLTLGEALADVEGLALALVEADTLGERLSLAEPAGNICASSIRLRNTKTFISRLILRRKLDYTISAFIRIALQLDPGEGEDVDRQRIGSVLRHGY